MRQPLPISVTRPDQRLWLILLLWLASTGCGGTHNAGSDPSLEIRGQRVSVEIAETSEAQRKGLGGRDSLAWDRGLLFVYDEPGFYTFWMKGMRFDIDIIWIREQRIVDIHHQVPKPNPSPEGRLPTYQPRELADRVLEVPAGYARAHGWRPGDWVEIQTGRD